MSILNSVRGQVPTIHREGYPFIGAFALASIVLFLIWTPLGWIGTVLTVWCALFFRDPERVTPMRGHMSRSGQVVQRGAVPVQMCLPKGTSRALMAIQYWWGSFRSSACMVASGVRV